MKNLQKVFKKLLNRTSIKNTANASGLKNASRGYVTPFQKIFEIGCRDFSRYLTARVAMILLLGIGVLFFYQVIFFGKVALPVDALVGAHIPWTETKWSEYPAGIPIKNLEITDAFSQFYPWRSLVGEFWRNGSVPLWNHYMFSGTPFLATLHSAALYPLNFVYLMFTDVVSWNVMVFLQIILSMLFMFLFLREITSDNVSSVFGAIAFGFSGYMIAWLEFATGGHAGLWLPLLLFLQYKFYKSYDLRYLLAIPFTIFLILTAGDFQVPFYSLTIYCAFSIFLGFGSGRTFQTIIYYFITLFLGILLSLVQWFPTLELFSRSVRIADPYIKEYYYGIFHWEKIVNFIWPDFFGNVVTGNYWGKFGYHEYLTFTGSITLVLVAFGFALKKVNVEKFFLGVLVVSLLFLFPTPLAFLPYKLGIPGLGTSSASRILFLVGFCLATLSALSLSKLNTQNLGKLIRSNLYLLIVSTGVVFGLIYSLYIFNKSGLEVSIESNLKVSLKNIIPSSLVLTATLLITVVFQKYRVLKTNNLKLIITVILLTEMLRFGWKNTPFSDKRFVFPGTEITKFLQAKTQEFRVAGGIPTNLFMPYKIKSIEGYDPIYPSINSVWYSYINSRGPNALSGRYGLVHDYSSPLLNISSVKYVVDYKKNSLNQLDKDGSFAIGISEPRFKEVFSEGRVKVFENTEVLPIVWLTDNYVVMNENNELLKKLTTSDLSDKRTIILSDNIQFTTNTTDPRYDISNYDMGMNEVNVEVATNKESLLFLSQTYDPGWKAYVNGAEVKIYSAHYLYQSIVLPNGKSTIQFKYSPKSFRIGRNIFIATLVIMIVGMIDIQIKKRKSN